MRKLRNFLFHSFWAKFPLHDLTNIFQVILNFKHVNSYTLVRFHEIAVVCLLVLTLWIFCVIKFLNNVSQARMDPVAFRFCSKCWGNWVSPGKSKDFFRASRLDVSRGGGNGAIGLEIECGPSFLILSEKKGEKLDPTGCPRSKVKGHILETKLFWPTVGKA